MPTKTVRVGDWQLVRKLGQGGFGEVLHWKNQSTNQEIGMRILCVRAFIQTSIYIYG